jgi:archaellum biogenesis protein FlaJ (TadC family)
MIAPAVIYERVGRLANKGDWLRLDQSLRKAGVRYNRDVWLGLRLVISSLVGVAAGILPFTVFKYFDYSFWDLSRASPGILSKLLGSSIALLLGAFVLSCGMFYMHLYYIIDDRRKRVEKVLPDFLLMVVANLKAGLTPFQAFRKASRPEFGPLEEEIQLAAARTMGTESLSQALSEITKGVDSDLLAKTVAFFDRGARAGGRLADLLESSADEMRQSQELLNALRAGTRTYSIFLAFIICLGLPLLLAISVQFVQMFSQVQVQQSASGDLGLKLFSGSISISKDFMMLLAYCLLVANAFMMTLLIGVISEGKPLYGVKYFIPIAAVALVAFAISNAVVGGILTVVG